MLASQNHIGLQSESLDHAFDFVAVRSFTNDYKFQLRESGAKFTSGSQQILKAFLKIKPGYHTHYFASIKVKRRRRTCTLECLYIDAVCDRPDFFSGYAGSKQSLRHRIRNGRQPVKSLERHAIEMIVDSQSSGASDPVMAGCDNRFTRAA